MPRKTKIGPQVAHVTHDSDTSFKVKRSKVNLQGAGAYCGGLLHSLLISDSKVHWRVQPTDGSQTGRFREMHRAQQALHISR